MLTFTDPAPFSPVEAAADWKLQQGIYLQQQKDGVRRSAHDTIAGKANIMASAKLRFLDSGDDGLTTPAKNISLAGVVLRTTSLKAGKGSGYYCGVDLQNGRLQLGKTMGDDLGDGKMLLFLAGKDAGVVPGVAIAGGVHQQLPYIVTLEVFGQDLSCQAVLPNQTKLAVIEAQDTGLKAGGVALFTAGARVQFETVQVCTP